jgi:uncharacterized protein (DUF488 family)
MMSLHILTIGHSSHPLGTFLRLLQKHEVEALVDVRRYSVSRRNPHFSREALSSSLAEESVRYHWFESLGGNRKRAKGAPPSLSRGIEDGAFRNYADYMVTDEFRKGATKLLEIARVHRTVIMCAESDYRHCHRQLLSDYLVANKFSLYTTSCPMEM